MTHIRVRLTDPERAGATLVTDDDEVVAEGWLEVGPQVEAISHLMGAPGSAVKMAVKFVGVWVQRDAC